MLMSAACSKLVMAWAPTAVCAIDTEKSFIGMAAGWNTTMLSTIQRNTGVSSSLLSCAAVAKNSALPRVASCHTLRWPVRCELNS